MIVLQNISKYYYSSNSVSLGLRKINLEFRRGEFVAITGESGSGKTTLANVISGQDSYEEGEMFINGQETSYYDEQDWETYRREKIGFIFQDFNLIDSYTVQENVEAVLNIFGYNKKAMRNISTELLEKVGLKEQRYQKAAKLSGGQKQRLVVARALAKNVDIIIADEPTGNLDSANGEQIIQLLASIAKDKLVIVVTHNYAQVAPYVSRKIRLYDGEIQSDEIVAPSTIVSGSQEVQKLVRNKSHIGLRFAILNMKSQPRKVSLLFILILITTAASFIFFGNFVNNIDDSNTKIYDSKYYYNGDSKRIIAASQDGNSATSKMYGELASLKHVDYIEKYDLVNEINYYYIENRDYQLNYQHYQEEEAVSRVTIAFINDNNYVYSSNCITDKDLKSGRLPDNFDEIVIYPTNNEKIGDIIKIYFRNRKVWNDDLYLLYEMKIVGILKDDDKPLYYSSSFCEILTTTFITEEPVLTLEYSTNISYLPIDKHNINAIFIINNELENNQFRISQKRVDQNRLLKNVFNNFLSMSITNAKEPINDLIPTQSTNNYHDRIVEVTYDTYLRIYNDQLYSQVGVYVSDTAYLKDVIKAINKLGYDCVSPYLIGSTQYDNNLVRRRLITLGVSLGAMLILYFLEIVVVYSLLKFKKNDFIILKMLGLDDSIIKLTNIIEILSYAVFASLIVILIAFILVNLNVIYVANLWKYYRFFHFIILFVVNIIIALLIARFFNRYLEKKVKISVFREEKYD